MKEAEEEEEEEMKEAEEEEEEEMKEEGAADAEMLDMADSDGSSLLFSDIGELVCSVFCIFLMCSHVHSCVCVCTCVHACVHACVWYACVQCACV